MAAVKTACDAAGVTLIVDEITPPGNQTDVIAAAVRTFNSNYAAWCLSNNVMLVRMHDQMGQIRVSTGQLDDLLAAYDGGDHIHLSLAGKILQANLWMESLKQ